MHSQWPLILMLLNPHGLDRAANLELVTEKPPVILYTKGPHEYLPRGRFQDLDSCRDAMGKRAAQWRKLERAPEENICQHSRYAEEIRWGIIARDNHGGWGLLDNSTYATEEDCMQVVKSHYVPNERCHLLSEALPPRD